MSNATSRENLPKKSPAAKQGGGPSSNLELHVSERQQKKGTM